MFSRCYSPEFHITHPCYKGCIVDKSWHNFQVFAEWHEKHYIENYVLDKDSKVDGNKIYSAEFCSYITPTDNSVEANAQYWEFIKPCGDYIKIYNLRAYCRDNNLDRHALSRINKGNQKKYKGWKRFI